MTIKNRVVNFGRKNFEKGKNFVAKHFLQKKSPNQLSIG
jgi:hypothetical protein